MLGAFIFGLAASSALLIGAVAGAYWTPPRRLLATALAFATAAGFLVSFLIAEL